MAWIDRRTRRSAVLVVATVWVVAACGSAHSHSSASRIVLSGGDSRPAALRLSASISAVKPATDQRSALTGKVVGIDPGHNGGNAGDPSFINHLIWNGRSQEACDTTGTETDGGYTEARFNFNVAGYLAADLRAEGARVVMTRTSNSGVGPCVNTRAQILNKARSNVAIDIHADGGPPGGRGFTVLEPVADGPNNSVIKTSELFGRDLLGRYRAVTQMPLSTYDGSGGISYRDDLAGLNLTTVPKVLIECGNMRNATDAASHCQRFVSTAGRAGYGSGDHAVPDAVAVARRPGRS